MGNFCAAAKNTMLNSLTADRLSLHTGDPGEDGLANEVTGGSPAYARLACTIAAASGGVRTLSSDVTFDVPACTVAYVGFWDYNAGSMIFHGSDIVTSEVFSAQGKYTVQATTTKLELTNV